MALRGEIETLLSFSELTEPFFSDFTDSVSMVRARHELCFCTQMATWGEVLLVRGTGYRTSNCHDCMHSIILTILQVTI